MQEYFTELVDELINLKNEIKEKNARIKSIKEDLKSLLGEVDKTKLSLNKRNAQLILATTVSSWDTKKLNDYLSKYPDCFIKNMKKEKLREAYIKVWIEKNN